LSQALIVSPLLAIAIFLAVFASDSLLTIHAARLYHKGADQIIGLEGSYELNPAFVKEVDRLRALGPRFVAMLGIYSLAILGIWYLCVGLSWFVQGYLLFIGAILLPQGPVHLRHIRNIAAFNHANKRDGIAGRIHYSRRFSYRLSAIELVSFSGLYLVLAGLSGSPLLLGGSIGTALLAMRSYQAWRNTG
jgi:hypothetical protein